MVLTIRYSLLTTHHSLLALSSPNFLGYLDDAREFRPLLVLGQRVAFLGRGKSTLAGEAKLVERREFRGLVDAALEIVLAFKLAGLGRDDAEHHLLAFRQHSERLEAA